MYTASVRLICVGVLLTLFQSFAFSQNAIVSENALPGNPSSEWDVSGAGDLTIQGFATEMGVNKGNTINFKVTSPAGIPYAIKIYRMGYYQGNGARLIADLGSFTGIAQAPCIKDTITGLVDCGNWTAQASWNIPSTAVSGIYIARLTRSDNGGSSHIIFVVRDDASNSPILFKTSDATWQGYNDYGGYNFYAGTTALPSGHAAKVSYNRPLYNRKGVIPNNTAGLTGPFNAEYPMVRWLERNGYDMSYTTCLDIARDPKGITPDGTSGSTYGHKIILSVAHDEYVSKEERLKFESARNAGVNLAYFSGNEVYWKTRWENSIDGASTPYRTLVCYKEGITGERTCGYKCDPLPNVWTGLWRSGCEYPGTDACSPENALTGQLSWEGTTAAITVPSQYKKYRLWKNTSIATLADGQSITFPSGTLGHEWDSERADFRSFYPSHRITLSNTNVSGAVHKLSLYKYSSGALVFGAGTVQWSWGLDDKHDRGSLPPSSDMQQATVNLLSDMGVMAGSIQSNLISPTPSSDITPPSTVITSPSAGTNVPANSVITISGTSADTGGEVGGVELSFDNGQTWTPADGATNWSYLYTTPSTGTVTILARAFDDSWNTGAQVTTTINITTSNTNPACPCNSLFGSTAPANTTAFNDGTPIVLGMRFRVDQDGAVVGVRFYKTTNNTGAHTGMLYSNTGVLLSQVTFSNESTSGWQEANFSTPVNIQAGITYVIAYHSGSGFYSATNSDFVSAKLNPPVTGLANGTDGPNGLYRYSSTPGFPSGGNAATNYWVDLLFKPTASSDQTPPVISSIVATPNPDGTATINWSTDEPSDSRVDYGTSPSALTLSSSNASSTVTHSIILSGLSAGTVYYYRVSSKDAAGNNTTSPSTSSAPLQFNTNPGPCASDNLVSEFSLGSTGTNTSIVNNVNGEVSLKTSFTEEQFTGSSAPSGWIAENWSANGTSVFAGGIATLNGAKLYTTSTFQQGSNIEFSARFSLGNFQNIGLALNGNFDPYWIAIGRASAGTLSDLYVRTSDGVQISLGTNLLNAYHTYRINWTSTAFQVYVDGNLAQTINKVLSTPLVFIASDFTVDGASLSMDYFRNINGGYPASGTFTSRVFSLGSNPTSATASWNATLPAGTGLSIAVRSGSTSAPDGSWTTFTTINNNQSAGISGSFLQYQASLSTTNPAISPLLNDIQFACSGTVQADPPVVTQNPSGTVNCSGSNVSFTSAATGTPAPTVQWQVSTDGINWTNITGATNATLSFATASSDNGKRYRAGWTNTGGTAYSTAATLAVNPLPAGSLSSGSACYGQNAKLTFTATVGSNPYSLIINGDTYNNIQSGVAFTTNTAVAQSADVSLWDNTVVPKDPAVVDKRYAMEMGTKFRTTVSGSITALRFYKGSRTDNGIYKLRLYHAASRALLAEVSYQNNNFSGFVTVALPSPVAIYAGELYVVSYFSPNRVYARSNNIFATDLTRGTLIGVGTATSYGPNGVFSNGGGFPTQSGAGKGYFADVVFRPNASSSLTFNLTRITDANGCQQTVNQAVTLTPTTCAPAATGKSILDNGPLNALQSAVDEVFRLEQNFPNPFNQSTVIAYTLPKPLHVILTFYDLEGRIVKVIDEGYRAPGRYTVTFDSRNMHRGIFLYRLQAGEFSATRKMIIQ